MMKKAASLLLAVLMLISVFPLQAMAAEPTDFEPIDSPMIENQTDSSKLPVHEAELSDVYGQTDTASADRITSMFSDDAWARFANDMDRALEFEPIADSEAAPVLTKAERFLTEGGLSAYLKSGNLLQGAEIGLRENRDDKVQVLGTDLNVSSWVYVVDKDAMCVVVQDENGEGIPNALVTISYLNEAGERVTQSVVATAGNTPGIAAFDDLPESFFGLLDMQAEGYRAVSVLDKSMRRGARYIYRLQPSRENELYIRGVDLSGKDLVNEETTLSLMDGNTADLTLKVLVTKTGSAAFPDSVEVRSENRGKTVLTISGASAYAYDANTRVYSATKRWAEKRAGLLQDGDEVAVRFGGSAFALEHLTVKDAVFNDLGAKDTTMPVTSKSMPGGLADKLGGGGALNSTFQILQVPISVGFFPDGSMILMASYDITKLAPEMQTKYSSLFDKSWNPKNMETSQNAFEVFERSFWENAEKVKGGKAVLDSADKIKCIANKNYNFSMSFSVFLRSNYNAETQDSYGTGGILFSDSLSGGVTEYFLFTAGPVVIPAYIGFEVGIAINTSLSVSFAMDKPPAGEGGDPKWSYANNGGDDWSGRIECILSFSVFGGVGVKGVLGACAIGFANMDIATVLGKGSASMVQDPHSFIDVLYGLRIEYYLLLYTGQINLDCAQDAKRIYDSDGDTDSLTAALDAIEFKELDLEACAVNAEPVLTESGEDADPTFLLADPNQSLEAGDIQDIDVSCYPDSQIQYVTTKNYTALFRLASDGERTFLLYQLMDNATGDLSSRFTIVQLPNGDRRSVSEFVAAPNKVNADDPNCCDNVYIGAILADNTLSDQSERMRSTDVAAIVVNLDRRQTVSAVLANDPAEHGKYLFSAPLPAGREDYCSVVYAVTELKDENGAEVTDLKALLKAIPRSTYYRLSSCEPGHPETRTITMLGDHKVYSSGAIAPNEPSYWQVDPLASSDKWLVIRGYGSNGYYAPDLRCNARIDVDGMIDPADIYSGNVDYDSLITNWQYLNGCNYFIAGDSVYWMNKHTAGSDPANYEWVVEKVAGGSGIVSADNRYAMITNADRSAVYLVGVVGDYAVDVEAGTAEKTSNRAQIHTITVDKDLNTGALKAKLHGPLTIHFAPGDVVESFTATYNSDAAKSKGLVIVYTTPDPDDPDCSSTRVWRQNASRGLLVTNVKIPDYLVFKGQPYIDLYVTVKNYGYAVESVAQYTVHDETGAWIMQCINGQDVGDLNLGGEQLYTGDARVDHFQIRPNPNWSLKEEHEIIVELRPGSRYDGDVDEIVNTAALQADNISFGAENTLVGGKHVVSTSITNNSLIGEERPVVKAVFDYGDGQTEKTMTFPLPMKDSLFRYREGDDGCTEQIYHFDIDMDAVWEQGLKDGLRGISFSLVSSDGEQQSNEIVYLRNPAEQHAGPEPAHVCPSARFKDVDTAQWYHEAVDYAVRKGLMNGVAADKFDPDGSTTRAMLVTILHRLEGEPAVSGKNPFHDVQPNRWYTDAVLWASANGIVNGYGDGAFGPMDTLTREQFAAILQRYAKYKGLDVSSSADLSAYTDAASISAWALNAMQWANAEGLITGRTATTLVPQGSAKRSETAAILMRFLEHKAGA